MSIFLPVFLVVFPFWGTGCHSETGCTDSIYEFPKPSVSQPPWLYEQKQSIYKISVDILYWSGKTYIGLPDAVVYFASLPSSGSRIVSERKIFTDYNGRVVFEEELPDEVYLLLSVKHPAYQMPLNSLEYGSSGGFYTKRRSAGVYMKHSENFSKITFPLYRKGKRDGKVVVIIKKLVLSTSHL